MRNSKIIPILFIILLIFIGSMFSIPNLWFLVTEPEYFIPEESSIMSFHVTVFNDGSGDWWLYGNDKENYYALNTETGYEPKYFVIKKKLAEECVDFNEFNYKTWCTK